MLNFHIRKVTLKNKEVRYRAVITRSSRGIKSKTFRRKADAKTWSSRTVLDYQEHEAKGIKPCTVNQRTKITRVLGKTALRSFHPSLLNYRSFAGEPWSDTDGYNCRNQKASFCQR